MSRNSLHRPRRPRAVWDRPAHDTRLLPNPFPPPVDGPSIDSTRHTSSRGHSRGYAPFQGLCPDFVGSPEAIAPRVYSPVASLGTPLSHGDGKEVTPDPLRTVESVWGSSPFLDSPVFPLGESPLSRDGRGSALPSLRLVERFPHTDRHEVPSRPVPSRVWRKLAPRPVRPSHGPSIAYPFLPTDPSFLIVPPAPESRSKMRQGVNPSPSLPSPSFPTPIVSQTRLRRESMGGDSARPERSRRVSRAEWAGVPPRRGAAHPERKVYPKRSRREGSSGGVARDCQSVALILKRPNRSRNSLQASFNQNSYEFNQVQSMFNQLSIKINHLLIKINRLSIKFGQTQSSLIIPLPGFPCAPTLNLDYRTRSGIG